MNCKEKVSVSVNLIFKNGVSVSVVTLSPLIGESSGNLVKKKKSNPNNIPCQTRAIPKISFVVVVVGFAPC